MCMRTKTQKINLHTSADELEHLSTHKRTCKHTRAWTHFTTTTTTTTTPLPLPPRTTTLPLTSYNFLQCYFLRNFRQQYIMPLFKLPAEIKRLFWRRTMTRKVWADKGRDPPSYNQCVHPSHHRLWRQLLRAHSLARRKTDWSDNSSQRDMQRDTTYCGFAHHKDNLWR